jgi:hypothetical protein
MQVWTDNPDGEYNEQYTTVEPGGAKLTIYSDRDGERWEAYLGDVAEDAIPMDADNAQDARTEALKWAQGQ